MSASSASGVSGCVMATIIAPCSFATSTALSRLRIRPTCEIASTTSLRFIVAAEIELQVGVEVRARGDAEPREARLRVARHEHRDVADAVAVDAPRLGDARRRAFEFLRHDVLLEIRERVDRALQHLVRHRLHVVAGHDRAVQRRLPDRKALRQAQLELAQAGTTQRATEAGDGRRAHLGPARQRVDIGVQRELRILEHRRGHLLVRQR